MTGYRLLYSGFDKFDVAFEASLPEDALTTIREAKERAQEAKDSELVTVGPGAVEMHVAESGMRGGYHFLCDTGPTGERWFIRDRSATGEYNVFASVHATALLSRPLDETIARLRDVLHRLGAHVGRESVNRIDYAMDFLAPDFVLDPMHFVAHPRSKSRVVWSDGTADMDRPSVVLSGRRVQSVTVGKMPGRQLIVYDKRREALDKQNLHWFRVWGTDPSDVTQTVWRIEVRAGKAHLRRYGDLRTFQAIRDSVGDVFATALEDVRYVAPGQTDSNITRQHSHPIWEDARAAVESVLMEHRSGLTANQIREIERETATETYWRQITGNGAGLAVTLDLSPEQAREQLPQLLAEGISKRMHTPDAPFWSGMARARKRLHFINPDVSSVIPISTDG